MVQSSSFGAAFYSLSKPELNLLIDFIESTEYKIIFAHIERYSKLYDKELYESVLSFDNALYQVNCDPLVTGFLERLL